MQNYPTREQQEELMITFNANVKKIQAMYDHFMHDYLWLLQRHEKGHPLLLKLEEFMIFLLDQMQKELVSQRFEGGSW